MVSKSTPFSIRNKLPLIFLLVFATQLAFANDGVKESAADVAAKEKAAKAAAKEAAKEGKVLLKLFKNAQDIEMKAQDHRFKVELKEFDQAQAAKRKEFQTTETAKRRKFFDENTRGPERRKYMHELIDRRKELEASLKDERTRKTQEQTDARLSMKQKHEDHLKKFEEKIQKGERPSEDLWPKLGR
jgi:hypothetical protein